MAGRGPARGFVSRAATALRWVGEGAAALARRLAERPPPVDRLAIFDDIFPCPFSSFRLAEFTACLAAFPSARVLSTGAALRMLDGAASFRDTLAAYAREYPAFAPRVAKYHALKNLRGRAAYTVFLNNARAFLPAIERNRLPFAFTLYPGGGFALEQAASDDKLRRVCASPFFRKVIATQPVTREYLVDRGFCRPEQVELIFGIVLPLNLLTRAAPPRKLMGRDKDTFDICFVAFKYMPGGVDKGYDLFVEAARILAARRPDFRFHVVGPYGEGDADVAALGDRIRFYGPRPTGFFPEFHAGMDLLLAPGPAFARSPGEFDGFPLGACIEAGLCGVALFSTDPLGQNRYFKDGEELVVIPRDSDGIADLVDRYYRDYGRLCELGRAGQAACRRLYGWDAQMTPRLRILAGLLGVEPPRLDAEARAGLP